MLKKYNPVTPGQRFRTNLDKSELSRVEPEKVFWKRCRNLVAVTIWDARQRGTVEVVTSGSIVVLTSVVTNTVCRLVWPRLNTTRTAARTSPC